MDDLKFFNKKKFVQKKGSGNTIKGKRSPSPDWKYSDRVIKQKLAKKHIEIDFTANDIPIKKQNCF